MRASRLALVLPPLVVAAGVAFVALRGSASGERRREEDGIRARWNVPSEFAAVQADAARHVDRWADAEARWFAAEAYARGGAYRKAFDVVLAGGLPATDPDAPRRLALLLLRHLGIASGLGPRALLVRAEVDDPGAREELERVLASGALDPDLPPGFMAYYKAASFAGGRPQQLLAEMLRRRPEEGLRLAAATLATGPRDRADVDLLLRKLGAEFARARRPTWRLVVRALGASRDPRALDALRARFGMPEGERPDRIVLRVGLALQEQEEHVAALLGELAAANADPDGMLYASGLATRRAQGDASAVPRMLELWSASPGPLTRLTLAYGVLLGEDAPPPEIPAAEWAAALAKMGPPMGAATNAAYRWRQGAPGARQEILDLLGRTLDDPLALSLEADGSGGPGGVVIEVLRALVRWPRPT